MRKNDKKQKHPVIIEASNIRIVFSPLVEQIGVKCSEQKIIPKARKKNQKK